MALILGIESSCDETACALVEGEKNKPAKILANSIASQHKTHAPFNGVVPELAARAHAEKMDDIIRHALKEANVKLHDLDAIAATAGPGLIGGLLVGLMSAKSLALALKKPFLAINHLEGHALTPRLCHKVAYPYLLLLVSGGHTQIIEVKDLGLYKRYGTTIDDALGEAFDKTAKLLDLGFPGGPHVEKAALKGHAQRFNFPRPMLHSQECNMSFAGLKTALRQKAEGMQPLSQQDIYDLCASFQHAVRDVLLQKLRFGLTLFEKNTGQKGPLVVAGGVASNHFLRQAIQDLCDEKHVSFIAPPASLCTDNAAMIAYAGLEQFYAGKESALDFKARSRWPLDEISEPLHGSGKRGAKA